MPKRKKGLLQNLIKRKRQLLFAFHAQIIYLMAMFRRTIWPILQLSRIIFSFAQTFRLSKNKN